QERCLEEAIFPSRYTLDVEYLDLAVDDAQRLAAGEVLGVGFVTGRFDSGDQAILRRLLILSLLLRREDEGHDLFAVVKDDLLLDALNGWGVFRFLGHELEAEARGAAFHAVAAHANADGHFVVEERDFRREQAGHGHFARRGDTDAPDVQRHALLAGHLRGSRDRRSTVAGAVGDQQDPRQRLAARAAEQFADRVTQARGRILGFDRVQPIAADDALAVGNGNLV